MAKRFRFKLEPVLRYREILEQQKRRDFAVANRAVEEEQIRQDEMRQSRETTQDELCQLYSEKRPFSEALEAYRFINTLDMGIARSGASMQKLEGEAEQKRAVLVEARRDRRALEVLKERRQEEYESAVAREEQTALDDLAVRVYRRRLNESEEA